MGKIMTRTNTVRDIVARLNVLDPYRIVLFGSHALDREHLESDVDLLVILDSDYEIRV